MTAPNPDEPLALLGGRSPAQFMRTHWQRKPLLIRQAIPGFKPPLSIAELKRMARQDDVASRLIWREQGQWQMEQGPFARLPKASEPDWTLLVQSVDLHSDAAAELMHRFRFVPDARLDDVMISIATDGGGVGPHFDSYDVFLLQAVGRREWRIGRQRDLSLEPGLPLKILRRFEPEASYVLEPGDMLYLPPQVAHDGIAQGDCMTISIGFRAPDQATLARGMLEAAAEQVLARAGQPTGPYGEPALPGPRLQARYRDPAQAATARPAELPDGLAAAALDAVARVRFDEALAHRFLGCWLTEPSTNAVFASPAEDGPDLLADWPETGRLRLDRRTRMLYRGRQLFINGETAPVAATPALRQLADARQLACGDRTARALSEAERECLMQWLDDGWLVYEP
jgi:50S ribosomal protein L16 3-hydroxylase